MYLFYSLKCLDSIGCLVCTPVFVLNQRKLPLKGVFFQNVKRLNSSHIQTLLKESI